MIGLLCFVLAVLAAPIKSKMRLEAENAVVPVGNLIRLVRGPNRAMLLSHEGSLQLGLVGAGLIVPVAGLIGS